MDNLIGFLFAILWGSGGVATKVGLRAGEPIILAFYRFLLAGSLMFLFLYVLQRKTPMPSRSDWKKLAILGILNNTLYTGCFYISSQYVSAGLLSLFVAINPLLIAFLSALLLKRKVLSQEIIGFLICFVGLLCASFPALSNAKATMTGILILTFGMICYSTASIFYAKMDVKLPKIAINTWQILIGGLLLLPVALLQQGRPTVYDLNFFASVGWMGIVISIGATMIWFHLLSKDTVRASQWLYLSPIVGYVAAYFFLGEPITNYAICGSLFVIAGLYIAKRQKLVQKV
ncbi:MAG: hypothetical protein RL757_1120 [Bacteroidota bacterium]|jgi:drug/metabolite transporter (DMT)-like permease